MAVNVLERRDSGGPSRILDEFRVRVMAKNAVAGVSNSQCGMIIKPSASMRATRETLRWSNIVSNKTCTSFRRLTVKIHAMGRLNVHCVETSHPCRPRLMSAPFGGRLPTFQIRASHGENVLPPPALSGDNGVATLDSLLDGSSSENKTIPDKIDDRSDRWEAIIERVIFNCRFFTLMAVVGSLVGSVLCFLKGTLFVTQSFVEYFQAAWQGLSTSKVVFLLVEAVDVYLMGTVMLIFGMGLYELFVDTLEVSGAECEEVREPACGSNLFGLFQMKERPKWLEIRSLDELKTKLGHVIVMILLVGMFEKSKKVPINNGLDLLCFSASILLSSGCLFLLSKLHSTHSGAH